MKAVVDMLHPVLNVFLACTLVSLFSQAVWAGGKLPVFVSIIPQKYFVQQIGKHLVDVRVMAQPGSTPHAYEPKPRQLIALSKAKLYFAVGVEFERVWLKKIAAAYPDIKVVHTDSGIDKIAMAAQHPHHEKDAYKRQNDPTANRLDPHIWLSPLLVKRQAHAISVALQESDPSNQSVYAANYSLFIAAIDKLDADLKTIFAGKQGLQFMSFHPSWGYFAHAYGLEQITIEMEGKNPKPAQLKTLIEHAREKGIKMIFAQPQFSSKSAKLIANEIHGQVVFADPMAADWMTNLRTVADKFRAALR